jgi:hypothetical protein
MWSTVPHMKYPLSKADVMSLTKLAPPVQPIISVVIPMVTSTYTQKFETSEIIHTYLLNTHK